MQSHKIDEPTGWPPVTRVEREKIKGKARRTNARPKARTLEATNLTGEQTTMANAMAAVVEEHRREIAFAAVALETRQYAIALLDAVSFDMLQAALGQLSVSSRPSKKRAPGR